MTALRNKTARFVLWDRLLATGQELSATVPALGLPHFDQAARVTRLHLLRSIEGNRYVEFETGPLALGLRPGDLIALTYLREGLDRTVFRIVRMTPGENFTTTRIVAQRHSDEWYELLAGGSLDAQERRRQNGRWGLAPRPVTGTELDAEGRPVFGVEEELADEAGGTLRLKVQYVKPDSAAAAGVSVPMVGLSPEVLTTVGSLVGGRSWYYAVSALAADGRETELSFVVRASVPAGGENLVRLEDLSFAAGTTGFRVYRGESPSVLLRIAEVAGTAATFTDTGLTAQCALPVDTNFDHARFYWRLESMPATPVSAATAKTLTSAGLAMTPNEFRSAVVRITSGKGAGQERVVLSHGVDTFDLQTEWTTVPDGTSEFVVAEAGWRFGAATRTDRVEFEVPNRPGVQVQISARAADVNGNETDTQISPMHRHVLGGQAGGDRDVPPKPAFMLAMAGSGEVWLTGIGFETLENTSTIESGTLVVRYLDEAGEREQWETAGAMTAEEEWIGFASATGLMTGDLVQVDRELMRVVESAGGGLMTRMERGVLKSTAAAHAVGAEAEKLKRMVVVAPFQTGLFGSSASGSYALPVTLKNARIAAAEFCVTNRIGDSMTESACYTGFANRGLRTYAGGQFTLQVEGDLAVETSATPPLMIEENRTVAEVRAAVSEAPVGGSILARVRLDGQAFCDLTIADGQRMSTAISGSKLGRLTAGSEITLDLLLVPVGIGTRPGRNLTVMLRV